MNPWLVFHGFFICFGLHGIYWYWKCHNGPDRIGVIISVVLVATNALALASIAR